MINWIKCTGKLKDYPKLKKKNEIYSKSDWVLVFTTENQYKVARLVRTNYKYEWGLDWDTFHCIYSTDRITHWAKFNHLKKGDKQCHFGQK